MILAGLTFLVAGCSASFRDDKKHPAEEKGIKSINSDVSTEMTFTNKSGKTVKVYWLDFNGERKLYNTLEEKESYLQQTYLTHPWLITDEKDNAWHVYYPDAQPRTIEIPEPDQN